MLVIMIVSLYTSRVVLQVLGVNDFGTYNIVCGVVTFFTFISSAMASGTQRHLSYELGKEDGNVSVIFSACLRIHFVIGVIVILLLETAGLWFLNNKMNFPEGRYAVVNWLYQFSVLTCFVHIIKVPFHAAIIAYERMSFYAYSSIIEAVLRLTIVYVLIVLSFDKLFIYGLLLLVIATIIFIWYAWYCFKKLNGIKVVKVKNQKLYKYILSFSGWALFGSLSNVGYHQGVNIIINMFFGVALNAAVGIATQINSAISAFASNFQQALNPQLIQAEASKNKARQLDLIFKSSKFSFYIVYVMAFPIIINLDYILQLWLGEYPLHTIGICNYVLIGILLESLGGPLWVTIFATGDIKYYQIIVSIVSLLVLPIIYIGGRFNMSPEVMFLIRALDGLAVLYVRLYFLKKQISLKLFEYFKKVFVPICIVTIFSYATYMLIGFYITSAYDFVSLVVQSVMYCSIAILYIAILGLNKSERKGIIKIIFNKIKL